MTELPSGSPLSPNIPAAMQQPSQIFRWLGRFAPAFCLNGSQVSVLSEPSAYYEFLDSSMKTFSRRAVLSALYLGTGQQEQQLVTTLQNRCTELRKTDTPFSVHFLLDYQRGSRGPKNSRTILLPLLQDNAERVKLSLFHTPNLRGIWKNHIPERWNEIVGLLHMKICVFDDNVLITGANLSDQYFTNRQDRYVLIKDVPELANFFEELVQGVAGASFSVSSGDQAELSSDTAAHPYLGSKEDFIEHAKDCVRRAYSMYPPTQRFAAGPSATVDDADTWIYPLVQMKHFDVLKDEKATEEILSSVPEGTNIHLASGYFNLTRSYRRLILTQPQAHYSILMASPQANGFFGAEGASSAVPAMYVQIAKTFFNHIRKHAQQHRIKLFEYYRNGWTFHVKGLWVSLPGQQNPALTLVGSPNFGYRSVNRDIEAQIALVTENADLQKRLAEERDRLFHNGQYMTDETFEGEHHQDFLTGILSYDLQSSLVKSTYSPSVRVAHLSMKGCLSLSKRTASASSLGKLAAIQRNAIRAISDYVPVPTDQLMEQFKILPLLKRWKHLEAIWLYKIKHPQQFNLPAYLTEMVVLENSAKPYCLRNNNRTVINMQVSTKTGESTLAMRLKKILDHMGKTVENPLKCRSLTSFRHALYNISLV